VKSRAERTGKDKVQDARKCVCQAKMRSRSQRDRNPSASFLIATLRDRLPPPTPRGAIVTARENQERFVDCISRELRALRQFCRGASVRAISRTRVSGAKLTNPRSPEAVEYPASAGVVASTAYMPDIYSPGILPVPFQCSGFLKCQI